MCVCVGGGGGGGGGGWECIVLLKGSSRIQDFRIHCNHISSY